MLTRYFKELVESKGYVVTDSLPLYNVPLYGKSQRDLVIYKSNGGFIQECSVMGAAITTEHTYEVLGAALYHQHTLSFLVGPKGCG